MFEQTVTVANVFYLLFGLVGLCGTVFAIWRGAKQDEQAQAGRDQDEQARIIRMDENIKQMTVGVADIKAEMRSSKKILDKHEQRIMRLELENETQWKRIDELKGGKDADTDGQA